MNILIFNWRDIKHPQAGGAELYLHELSKVWLKKGNNVTWITSRPKGAYSSEIIDGINVLRIGGEFSLYLLAPLLYYKIRNNIDAIIDAENGIPFFTPLFSRKKKILLIYHIHKDVWFKEKRFPLSYIGYFLETKLMPFVYRNTSLVTISESSKEEIKKIMPNNVIDIIYCSILGGYFPSKKDKIPSIIFTGRLKKYKSVDVLLRAVNLLDKKVIVDIIGTGDDEDRLKSLSKELNLQNVNFLGFVSEENKIKHLQKAWIMVNPSFVEGWSITNIEANACGTPVIGSNVNGIKDSIIDGKTGLLFKYGDEKELAEKINLLLNNNKIREKMSKEALKWANSFSWEVSGDKLINTL